jgi:hypothetical protein
MFQFSSNSSRELEVSWSNPRTINWGLLSSFGTTRQYAYSHCSYMPSAVQKVLRVQYALAVQLNPDAQVTITDWVCGLLLVVYDPFCKIRFD